MNSDKRDTFFQAHMNDLARKAFYADYPQFSDFLTGRELTLIEGKKFEGIRVIFFGGHEDCDHVMAGFFPESSPVFGTDQFPVSAIEIREKGNFSKSRLEHRDYLGAVLALGIERNKIGDIRICDNLAFLFCHREFASYILDNLISVGRVSVDCRIVENPLSIPAVEFDILSRCVASARLDSIVAAITGLSRTKAAELVKQGAVVINHSEKSSISFICPENSVLTIRGYGKFRVVIPEDSLTKKGRQKIIIYKYK